MEYLSIAELKMAKKSFAELLAYKKVSRFVDLAKKSPTNLNLQPNIEPLTENNVWQLWLQGFDSLPPIVRACVNSVDRHLEAENLHRLGLADVNDHLDLPGFIFDMLSSNQISSAQFSDIVRAGLLAQHGGTWIDTTVWLSEDPKTALGPKSDFFAFSGTPKVLGGSNFIRYSSWFLSAASGSPTFSLLYNSLIEYWRKNHKLSHYYQFHFMLAYISEIDSQSIDEQKELQFISNVPPHYLQFSLDDEFSQEQMDYFKSVSPIHKLSHYGFSDLDSGHSSTFLQHILKTTKD